MDRAPHARATFNLGLHAWYEPPEQLLDAAAPGLQGDLDVVRCTLPCIRAARPGAVGEMAKNLDAVVKKRKR